jgi:DHA1 family bicyclomycin/chloramphenicol resistance-like MFS transporter
VPEPHALDAASRPGGLGQRQFIFLLSMVMAMAALGIDLMLPAFDDMREAFGLAEDSNEVARTVTAYFLGMAIPQVVYGPLADRYGRKPVLYLSIGVYSVGAVASALAPSLTLLLLARFVWGIGAAGGRVVALAIIRDVYRGERMARAMSYIMSIFILVPVVAPSLGAVIVEAGSWRWAFWASFVAALALLLWSLRLRETLDPAHRKPMSFGALGEAARRLATSRTTLAPTLALTCMMGVMTTYLASSELIISEIFGRGDQFPVVFGVVALLLGVASFLNGQLVGRVGIRRLLRPVLACYVGFAAVTLAVAVAADGSPDFWVFMPLLTVSLCCQMLLTPNLNTLAMEPVGDIAGTASALIGSVSIAGGALIGALVDPLFDDSVTPMAATLLLAGVAVTLLVAWGARHPTPVPAAAAHSLAD